VSPFHLEVGTSQQNKLDVPSQKRRQIKIEMQARIPLEIRKARARRMRAAVTPEGKRLAYEKMIASLEKRNTASPSRSF
jgi:hypothetical protein